MDSLLERLEADDIVADGRVAGHSSNGAEVTIGLELSDAEFAVATENWRVICEETLEYSFCLPNPSGVVDFFGKTHSAVRQFVDPRIDVYFSGQPRSSADLLVSLADVHRRIVGDWFPIDRYLRASMDLLGAGAGKIFSGPEFLLSAYRPALQQSGLVLSELPASDGCVDELIHMLVVGKSYIVGRKFHAIREGAG